MSELIELTASELDLIAGGVNQTNNAAQAAAIYSNAYYSDVNNSIVQQIAQANAYDYSNAYAANYANVDQYAG
ncbi:MAG: hypothetical protein JO110_18705 [Acetobacteraceae bacterium]|nr:hypothetical protein [Acetobacteraceae bacterium]